MEASSISIKHQGCCRCVAAVRFSNMEEERCGKFPFRSGDSCPKSARRQEKRSRLRADVTIIACVCDHPSLSLQPVCSDNSSQGCGPAQPRAPAVPVCGTSSPIGTPSYIGGPFLARHEDMQHEVGNFRVVIITRSRCSAIARLPLIFSKTPEVATIGLS